MKDKTKVNPVLSSCPVCKSDLYVEKLHCHYCGTSVEGNFSLSKFNYLEPEKLYFIEVFVKNRGNIKQIEKELNISYPTVKRMLDEVIVGMGYPLIEEDEISNKDKELLKSNKASILERIERKEISVEEAIELLKKK